MSEKCVSCASCGFPMERPGDFANGDLNSIYCCHCVDEKGRRKPYEEVLEMNAKYFEEHQGLDPRAARKLAASLLSALPAWKDRASATIN